jgi:hypothetical protein
VQEYFVDLYRLRRQSEWSYSSVHALAAKDCLLLLNDPLCDNLNVSVVSSTTGLTVKKGSEDEQSDNDKTNK